MNDDQITALAREYAEEMIKGKSSEELPNCLKNSMLAMNTEYVAEIFQWLTRRYCLVKKSKIGEAYFMAKNKYDNAESPTDMDLALAQKEILDFIIPEIAKEVKE